jgi:orotate phosphoribosyltransferase
MASEKEVFLVYNISSLIEDAGFTLCEHPRNTRILRLMQERIDKLSRNIDNDDVIFITGFLRDYIDRLWFNLAVDFSYEAGDIGKVLFDDLVQNVGLELQKLAKALREEDPQTRYIESYRACARLTSVYREKLRELESKAKKIKLGVPTKITNWAAILPENKPLYQVFENCGVVYQSEHALAAGTESNYFFDVDRLLSTPQAVSTATKYYVEKIAEIESHGERIDKLAFIDKDIGTVGSLPLMASIVMCARNGAGIDAVIVRFRKEIPIGDIKCAYGYEPKKGENVVIVSDVLTSGGGIEKALDIISAHGASVRHAIVLYDRGQTGEKLKRKGVEVNSVTTAEELLKAYKIDSSKEQNFDNPGADTIPLAEWKIRRFSEKMGPERMHRLENAQFVRSDD